MRGLLAGLQFEGSSIRMVAVNDDQISAPIENFLKYDVLVASTQNGAALEIRSRGPLRVIYPIDDHSELANEQIVAKMIWRLASVTVE